MKIHLIILFSFQNGNLESDCLNPLFRMEYLKKFESSKIIEILYIDQLFMH